jgi:hypothetical protein
MLRFLIKEKSWSRAGTAPTMMMGLTARHKSLFRVWNEFYRGIANDVVVDAVVVGVSGRVGILSSTTKGRSDTGAFLMFDQPIHDARRKTCWQF